MAKVKALLFDVNGTLFPADAAATAFQQLGLPGGAVEASAAWQAALRCYARYADE